MSSRIRYPRVAGSFYAGSETALRRQIEGCFTHRFGPGQLPKLDRKGPRKIFGLVCPHAGYVYSGPVAANAYYRLSSDGPPELFVILGPNHYGVGSGVAVMDSGVWRTPLGDAEIDMDAARELVRRSGIIDIDESAHAHEHSIEVQLPFLQYIFGSSFRFVPICFLMQDIDTCREVGEALRGMLEGKNAVVIASTDMTHYEPHKRATEKDEKALDAILKLDEGLFYSILRSYNVSVCGYGPVATLITAASKSGVSKAELLSYKTSGDITGDKSGVVGYAAIAFEKQRN